MLSALLNGIIRFALHNRMLVAALATFLLLYGTWQMIELPIDVFPDLNRPRVVIMTEAHGMAPEEVESLVTLPIETALNGAPGVEAVRSSSAVGMSVVYVEFDWDTDIYNDRQVVAERLAVVADQLPEEVRPQLAPISSIMGQIVMVGMLSDTNEKTLLREVAINEDIVDQLDSGILSSTILSATAISDSRKAEVAPVTFGSSWTVQDFSDGGWFTLKLVAKDRLEIHRRTSPMEMRTIADWVVRQQLLTIPGVSQVFVMGGDRKQFQVLVDPNLMLKFGVSLHEIEMALERSNENATGGYLDEQGPNEFLVRALGRIQSLDELKEVVIKSVGGQSIVLGQVARVVEGAQVKRGLSTVYARAKNDDTKAAEFFGGPAIVLTITKQPGADTKGVTLEIDEMMKGLDGRLADDIRLLPEIYQQKSFIDIAIENVAEALRDGGILVVVILFLFLLNFRTTFITLTAIPLSIVVTALVFKYFGLSINTMTLGGLAVAIGELVDDAIVDVENIFRRLKENKRSNTPKHPLLVVFQASVEIRNSIVFGTMIVVLVFIPLFAMGGMEGRLFTPLGIAYIVSILSSLLVSLTVTPVLSYWLLKGKSTDVDVHEKDSILLRFLKWIAGYVIGFSLRLPVGVLTVTTLIVIFAGLAASFLEQDFLPPFDEGAVQLNVVMPPGTSLAKSDEVGRIVDQKLQSIPELLTMVRRTGRAELDEHAMTVNISEIVCSLDQHGSRSREEILDAIRQELDEIPGVVHGVDQPLAHLISHMLSGVMAQVAIKVYGDDLVDLRRTSKQIEAAIAGVRGVKDLQVEQQTEIPQLQIEVLGDRLRQYGLTRGDVTEFAETAMNGHVVSDVRLGQRKFDLMVRLDEPFREDIDRLGRLSINLPSGGTAKLEDVAIIKKASGPNTINREQVRRRVVVQCNVSGRGLVDVVEEIKQRVKPIEDDLASGYYIEYGGQFESQQSASRIITILFCVSLVGMFLVLYSMFGSANLALQVMVALPMAFIGSVLALYLTGQTLTIAAKVGFISLCGIATRNGILLINHYLHLVRLEGESWTREMVVRAGQERLAPVLMTALTSGIGLIPLALAAGEPGKEILYPVATVIIGGLISSTILEFLVRPALFWQFGLEAGKKVVEQQQAPIELVDERVG